MTFRVLIHPKVAKSLIDLPGAHQKKIAELVEILKENPVPRKNFDVRKLKGYDNRFRIRLGDFRLSYEFDKGELCVLLLKLERRRKAYR